MTEQTSILFFNFNSDAMLPREITEHFSDDEGFNFNSLDTPLEASDYLNQTKACLFLFLVNDKQDLSQISLLLKRFKSKISSGKLKPVAILKDYSRESVAILKRYGCSDFYNFKVSAERLIESIEGFDEDLLMNDPEMEMLDIFEEEIPGAQKFEAPNAEIIGSSRIESVTDTLEDDTFHYQALEHPKIGGVNLESGRMELNISQDLPQNSQFFLEHFDSNELEFEVKTEQAIGLAEDEDIEVQIVFLYDRCRVELLIAGKIQSISAENDVSTIVTVDLSQDESLKLEQFMALYQKRQAQISDFMEMAKGLEDYSSSKKDIA